MRRENGVHLAAFSAAGFDKGAGLLKQTAWYFVNALIVRASWNPFMGIKIALLKMFGARIGRRLIIKNNVNVKFPWKLTIGDDCWIGEGVWIDNLDMVTIGNDVCISQGAMLLTGNHDYTQPSMPYRNAPIRIDSGAWIGAKAVLCPGVNVYANAVLTVGSIATTDMQPATIYQGNPAKEIRKRKMKSETEKTQ